jgi:hypothetical protein
MNQQLNYRHVDHYDKYNDYTEYRYNNIYNNKYNKSHKKVEFSNFRDVIYIPKTSELYDTIDLWWSQIDKSKAYSSMANEIKNIQMLFPNMTMKQAMKFLYQPNNLIEIENYRSMVKKKRQYTI